MAGHDGRGREEDGDVSEHGGNERGESKERCRWAGPKVMSGGRKREGGRNVEQSFRIRVKSG